MARTKKLSEIEMLIDRLRDSEDYQDQLVFARRYPPRKAVYSQLKPPPPGLLASNLKALGIEKLYSHQAEAVRLARAGRSLVLATDTSSGKSLCYNIPVIETMMSDPEARALYIFPTKALGQDQTRMIHEMADPESEYDETRAFHSVRMGRRALKFGTYDGDTSKESRSALRREANILLTNPDMLSLGILPNHSRWWSGFFRNLRYVVLDEIHTYRGVFGSHAANLMRRLRRICAAYGSDPAFICCSATIGNPGEHASRLVGGDVAEITRSGAPAAGKLFVMWNPPLARGSKEDRRSPITESINLFSHLIGSGLRTIVFGKAKPTVEVILRMTREKLMKNDVGPDAIASYRGGYLPSERRAIERSLARGELLGVACTNALELGVDIGSLDAAVINGFPGSISSVWQQAGRAGRRHKQSLAVMVAYPEPLDQYLMRNPDYFFGSPVERAVIHPSNPYILEAHLRAAAAELPLKRSEEPAFGENFVPVVRKLIKKGELVERRGGACYAGDDYPAADINLRSAGNSRYCIMLEDGNVIGEMESSTVQCYLHEGAVYLQQGENYYVKKLDTEKKTAVVSRKDMPYYTRSLSREWITVDRETKRARVGATDVFFGYVFVTSRVHSYRKIRNKDKRSMGTEDLDFPEERLWTQCCWFSPSEKLERRLQERGMDLAGGLHALEHATLAMLPLLAMCDRQDVGGVSTDMHPDAGNRPAIFLHDAYEGGMGLAEAGFNRIEELFEKTLELISGCPCEDGCPSCVQSAKCGSMNNPLDKRAAAEMLKTILKGG